MPLSTASPSGAFLSTCPVRGTTGGCAASMPIFTPFLSTCPVRGTTGGMITARLLDFGFLSTCPVRGTTRIIEALRNEEQKISIHVPREGHDLLRLQKDDTVTKFLSTCPVRGTTAKTPKICRRFCSIMAMI